MGAWIREVENWNYHSRVIMIEHLERCPEKRQESLFPSQILCTIEKLTSDIPIAISIVVAKKESNK
jgi:hypothetical protein